MKVNEEEFGNQWKPVCAICQHIVEREKEPPLDDDDCECRLPPRRKPRPEDIRFWCTQEKHLKLNFVTGEKYPVPCMEYNSHGACREFEAVVPTEPVFSLENNIVTLELALGSMDGTVIYYRIKPVDFADTPEQEEMPWTLYEQPIAITEDVSLEYVAVLANSRSSVFVKLCSYIAP